MKIAAPATLQVGLPRVSLRLPACDALLQRGLHRAHLAARPGVLLQRQVVLREGVEHDAFAGHELVADLGRLDRDFPGDAGDAVQVAMQAGRWA